jgi:hypothetical protein
MESEKNIIFPINKVKIYAGEVFDFVNVNLIEDFSQPTNKIMLVYKRRSDKVLISFSSIQASYFTVNGNAFDIPNLDRVDTKNMTPFTKESLSERNRDSLIFVDTFTVLKGNDGNENHRPNLDIDQPLFGIGLDWMKSSIEKRKLDLALKELDGINKIKRARAVAAEEEKQRIISKILEEEKEQAINENSYESLTRHFLTLNQNLFAYALKTSKK